MESIETAYIFYFGSRGRYITDIFWSMELEYKLGVNISTNCLNIEGGHLKQVECKFK